MKNVRTHSIILSIIFLLQIQQSTASIFKQAASGNWNSLSTWSVNGAAATSLPGSFDFVSLYPDLYGSVTIPAGYNPGTISGLSIYLNQGINSGTYTALNNNSGYPLSVTYSALCFNDNTATNKTFTIGINASGTGSAYVFNSGLFISMPIGNGNNVIYQFNAPTITIYNALSLAPSSFANATALTSVVLEIMPGTTVNSYGTIGNFPSSSHAINPATNSTFQTDAGSTLNIYNSAVFGSLVSNLNNYIYCNGNVNFLTAGAQTIYTSSTPNLTNASTFGYANLTIGNTSGVATVNSGVLNVSGNFVNSTSNSASNYIDFITNKTTLNLNGASQTLNTSASGNQTKLYNLTVASTNSASLAGAAGFSIASKGILSLSTAATLNANGLLTLSSDANGCASVAPILNGGTVNGNVIVQRYLSGSSSGTNYRGYRLIAAPVYLGTYGTGVNYFQFINLISATFLTGSGGAANGFDKAGNPSIYLFNDYYTPANNDFISGNWAGVSSLKVPYYPYFFNQSNQFSNIFLWPSGSGALLFFRGSRSTANPYTPTSYAQASTVADTGTLVTGNVNACPVNYINTNGTLTYSTTNSGNTAVRGFNLMGNPYACTIDWNTSTTGGINMANVSNTIYELNLNGTYGTYQWNGTTGTSTNNGSRYIASGQGFFVKATNASATFQFTENAKAVSANYNPVMGTPLTTQLALIQNKSDQHLLLSMQMDSVNYEETFVGFSPDATTKLKEDEDARYLMGSSKVHFASLSADNVVLAINRQPLPGLAGTTIPLKIAASTDGTYFLTVKEITNIPSVFKLWLKDNYLKDSIDLRKVTTYSFNILNGDSTTYGTKRFVLSISQDTGQMLKVLSFTAHPKAPKSVQVKWTVKNDFYNARFAVEKSTTSGNSYSLIDTLTSNGLGNYSFNDTQPCYGTSFYRLKMTDFNGTITYTMPVTVSYNKDQTDAGISMYPNPATNQINIVVNQTIQPIRKGYRIIIYNTSGIQVLSGRTSTSTWLGNLTSLSKGTYLVKVATDDGNTNIGSSKFVKN